MGCLCEKQEQHNSIAGETIKPGREQNGLIRSSYYQQDDEVVPQSGSIPITIENEQKEFKQKHELAGLNEFQIIKVLGRGSFGKVLLVERRGKYYAMKVMKKSDISQKNQKIHTMYERMILANTDSNFIVKLHFAFQSKDKLYLVMDFQQGGELFFHLRKSFRFTEQKTIFYAGQLVLALEHLHSLKVIYRDLKPENILLGRDGNIKITDFGLSKYGQSQGEKSYSFVGTPEYLAPEIVIGQGHTYMCDFWSLGAIIYEMLTGAPPFYSRDKQLMFKNRLEKPIEMKSYFSNPSTSILQGLLCNDPRYRLGAGGINEIKDHEFFVGVDWEDMKNLKVTPPFIPVIDNLKDLRYFDPLFTQEAARDTPCQSNNQTIDKYMQFTYQKSLTSSSQKQSQDEKIPTQQLQTSD